jgi:hypothetical protein
MNLKEIVIGIVFTIGFALLIYVLIYFSNQIQEEIGSNPVSNESIEKTKESLNIIKNI